MDVKDVKVSGNITQNSAAAAFPQFIGEELQTAQGAVQFHTTMTR